MVILSKYSAGKCDFVNSIQHEYGHVAKYMFTTKYRIFCGLKIIFFCYLYIILRELYSQSLTLVSWWQLKFRFSVKSDMKSLLELTLKLIWCQCALCTFFAYCQRLFSEDVPGLRPREDSWSHQSANKRTFCIKQNTANDYQLLMSAARRWETGLSLCLGRAR